MEYKPYWLAPDHLPGRNVTILDGKHKGKKAEIKFPSSNGKITVRVEGEIKNCKFHYKNLELI